MKILHTADLHLGAPMRAILPPREQKLRREELLSSFLRLSEAARREGCAAVIIAGDLFDTEAAAMMLSPSVLDVIGRFPQIDFYYVSGNHEREAELLGKTPENLHIFGDSFTFFEKENVVFFGKRGAKYTDFENICLQERKINILVAHGAWAEGYNRGADLPLGFLRSKGIDYCALGHYHSYSERRIDYRGIAVYPGCPEGRGFDEIGQKGAVLIETAAHGVSHRFLPLCRRTLHRIEVCVSDAKSTLDIFMLCDGAVKDVTREDLVRLVLTGARVNIPMIDPLTVERHFLGRFYHVEIEDRTVAAPVLDTLYRESSLRGELVRRVSEDKALTPEQKKSVIALGLAALNGTLGGDV